jgi:hypothetical protein
MSVPATPKEIDSLMHGLVRNPTFNDKESVAKRVGYCQRSVQRSRHEKDGGKKKEGEEKPPLPGRYRNGPVTEEAGAGKWGRHATI